MAGERCAYELHFEFGDGVVERAALGDFCERRKNAVVGCNRFDVRIDVKMSQRLGAAFKFGREMVGRYDFVIDRAGDDALNLVAELADVALPVANHHQIDRLRRESYAMLAEP